MIKRLLLIIVFCVAMSSFAQVGVGEWSSHFPYRKATLLERVHQSVFCLTQSGVYSYSLEDGSIRTYGKNSGLTGVDVTVMAGSDDSGVLLLGYEDGNVDILSERQIVNIPDIKYAGIVGDKGIYSVLLEKKRAMLGTGFGIVVVDIEKEEISDTYFIGPQGDRLRVNEIVMWDNYYWAATNRGLFRAGTSESNLADFNRWEHISIIGKQELVVSHILGWGERLVIAAGQSDNYSMLLEYKEGECKAIIEQLPGISSLRLEDSNLWICSGGELMVMDNSDRVIESFDEAQKKTFDVRDAFGVDGQRRFFADFKKGMLEYQKGSIPVEIRPQGPSSEYVGDLLATRKGVWVVPGKGHQGSIELFDDHQWEEYTPSDNAVASGIDDIHILASDTQNEDNVFAGSWGSGVLHVNTNKEVEHWDNTNSPLGGGEVFIGGMAMDSDGSLWVLDNGQRQAIKVRSAQGEWNSLYFSALADRTDMHNLIVSSNGDKWCITDNGGSIFAFNENQTVSNGDDDFFRSFKVRDENGRILASHINVLEKDHNGSMWVGSDNGVTVYAEPRNVWGSQGFYASRPVVSDGGQSQYLLGTEKVNAIAVDGANQKWIGTDASGVFLVSDTGEQQVLNFNADNSPMPSNRVLCIAVHPFTGEVFFGTDRGLVSYRNSVTEGASDFDGAYVFPNPVREDYKGDVVVTGLMKNTSVKIVDVTGNLVFEGESKGGQLIWNGKTYSGKRAHTGVYIILCASEDGSESKAIKLLMIN